MNIDSNKPSTKSNVFSSVSKHVMILTMFCLLFICSCSNGELKTLEANRCLRCKKFLEKEISFQSKAYLTKNLKPYIDRNTIDGPNYIELAKEHFRNKKEIHAVNFREIENFKDHIYCLIGLNLDAFRNILPSAAEESKLEKDSTLLVSFLIDTVKRNEKGEAIWMGRKNIYSIFKEVNQEYILVGTDPQKYFHEECLSY